MGFPMSEAYGLPLNAKSLLESENTSDHERQNVIGKPGGGAPNMEDSDTMHEKMIELESLLEASGERNLRSPMENAHATVWHKRCGIQITRTSAWCGI